MKEDKRYQNTPLGDYCEKKELCGDLDFGPGRNHMGNILPQGGHRLIHSSVMPDNDFLTYNDLFSKIYTILGFFVVSCFIS